MPLHLLGTTAEIPPGGSKAFPVGLKRVMVARVGGAWRAWVDFCPHMGGRLRADGRRITCDWHGAQFSCEDGRALSAPAPEGSALVSVALTEENGKLFCDPDSLRSPWADDGLS